MLSIHRYLVAILLCLSTPALVAQSPEDYGLPSDQWAYVPGGTYHPGILGQPDSPPWGPEVTVSPFIMRRFEIRLAQFQYFAETTGYWSTADSQRRSLTWRNTEFNQYEDHPVIHVSWYDAITFCNWYSSMMGLQPVYLYNGMVIAPGLNEIPSEPEYDGSGITRDPAANGFRLPTEAEWEWAAKGGPESMDYEYAGTDESLLAHYAWYIGNAAAQPHAVGELACNELGIFDLSGNVAEWCEDRYGEFPQTDDSSAIILWSDPAGPNEFDPENPRTAERAVRGGSWMSGFDDLIMTVRASALPDTTKGTIGFRVVRSIPVK